MKLENLRKFCTETVASACKEATEGYNEANKINNKNVKDVVFEVLQCSEMINGENVDEVIRGIAEFYDKNWTGNADFMHIPGAYGVATNFRKCPIIIARCGDEILGLTTIKDESNNEDDLNPYYPVENVDFLSITGILTSHNSNYKGIGKKLYEIALKSLQMHCKKENENKANNRKTTVMCEIDCRNAASLGALSYAVGNLQKQGFDVNANCKGIYLVRDEEKQLVEAPTFVIEIDFDEREKSELIDSEINYGEIKLPTESSNVLFENLFQSISSAMPLNLANSIHGYDGDATVEFIPADPVLDIQELCLSNTKDVSSIGNDREPNGEYNIVAGPLSTGIERFDVPSEGGEEFDR